MRGPNSRRMNHDTTRRLARIRNGDAAAVDELFALVYDELRGLARAQRRRWEGDHTLNTTVLVHEAYLRLVDQTSPEWRDRAHFMAVAARAMRHILIDYARQRQAQKRGGARERLSLDEIEASLAGADPSEARDEALLALDASLERLARESERQSRIVECRFFGGMTIEETAEAVGVSPATVKRASTAAQAWLYRDLRAALGETGA
jgi:RNA polymerase sigma factor (TIGR02999 family)